MPLGMRSIATIPKAVSEARGQHDQPEVGPGPGDQVDPTGGGRVMLGFRLGDQAHFLALRRCSGLSRGRPARSRRPACRPFLGRLLFASLASSFSSAGLDRCFFRQVISPFDDHRLSFLEVGAGDFDRAAVRRLGLGMQHHRLAVAHDVQDRALAQVEDGISRDLEHALALVDDDRHANRLADGEPPVRVVDQNADGQVAGLRVGHAADERDLSRHLLFFLGRGVGRRVAGIAGADGAAIPMRTDAADRGGSQMDAKTCRESTTSPIGVPTAIVWPG